MIRERFNKIVGWYNDLDSIKKLIVTFFGLIILIILVNILGNINFEEGIIEYNWDSGNNLVSNLTVNNDREIYLKSNVILKNLINTTNNEFYIKEEKVKISDWYKYVVFEEYKSEISSGEFKKIVKKISDEFNIINKNNESIENIYNSLITNIYLYSESYNMYVVEFNIGENLHYIGLKFNSDNSYSIFYIE